jgi:hypothetical protein
MPDATGHASSGAVVPQPDGTVFSDSGNVSAKVSSCLARALVSAMM